MKITLVFLCLWIMGLGTLSAQGVATVTKLKGAVLVNELPLQLNDFVKEGATITSSKGSFVQLKFNDNTIVSIGPSSELTVKSYRKNAKGKRQNALRLLKGKARVLVNTFAEEGEKIQFNSGQISLGVRGTEFLVNSYGLGGAPSSDVLLVKGSLRASGSGFNAFTMSPGQYFNSQDLMRSGMKALKTLGTEALKKIKEGGELFLPELNTPSGLTNLGQALTGVASVAAVGASAVSALLPNGGDSEEAKKEKIEKEKEKVVAPVRVKNKTKPTSKVSGVTEFKYDLTKEKWEIRDAVLNRDKNKKENKCFFFFYKKLPGAGEPELFRRKRDCDEFEYEL